jgi:hypothetical protein
MDGAVPDTWQEEAAVPPYSTDIGAAMLLAEAYGLTLVPFRVYRNQEQWDRPYGHEPVATYWGAYPQGMTAYLPIEQFVRDWPLEYIDTALPNEAVAQSAPLALCLAALRERARGAL